MANISQKYDSVNQTKPRDILGGQGQIRSLAADVRAVAFDSILSIKSGQNEHMALHNSKEEPNHNELVQLSYNNNTWLILTLIQRFGRKWEAAAAEQNRTEQNRTAQCQGLKGTTDQIIDEKREMWSRKGREGKGRGGVGEERRVWKGYLTRIQLIINRRCHILKHIDRYIVISSLVL